MRLEVHIRCRYAESQYYKYLLLASKQTPQTISGYNSYKLNQAYRVWIYYRNEFLNNLPEYPKHRPTLKRDAKRYTNSTGEAHVPG